MRERERDKKYEGRVSVFFSRFFQVLRVFEARENEREREKEEDKPEGGEPHADKFVGNYFSFSLLFFQLNISKCVCVCVCVCECGQQRHGHLLEKVVSGV